MMETFANWIFGFWFSVILIVLAAAAVWVILFAIVIILHAASRLWKLHKGDARRSEDPQ